MDNTLYHVGSDQIRGGFLIMVYINASTKEPTSMSETDSKVRVFLEDSTKDQTAQSQRCFRWHTCTGVNNQQQFVVGYFYRPIYFSVCTCRQWSSQSNGAMVIYHQNMANSSPTAFPASMPIGNPYRIRISI